MRDSFVFYRSFAEACRELSPEDFKAAVLAMCDYAMDDIDTEADGVAKAILIMAKPVIDSNNQKYKNGSKGGRPKNQTETKPKPKHNQTETKRNQTVTKPKPYVDVDVDKDVDVDAEVDEKVEEEVDVEVEKRKQSKREAEIIPTYVKDPVLNATILEFLAYRKQMRSSMSDIAVTKMLAKLEKIGKSDHERIEILNQSMENGWKGIFPLDKVKPKNQDIDWETL